MYVVWDIDLEHKPVIQPLKSMKSPYSLQKRLILYTSLFSVIMGCVLVAAAYRIALEETNEILNAQMKNLAERVAKFHPDPVRSKFNDSKHYHEEDLFVDVWSYAQQDHLHHELNLLVAPVKKAGFYPQDTLHGPWQTYVIPLAQFQIQVSQPESIRQHLALQLAANMFAPYLLIMPFAIWGLSLIIRRSFKPLENFKNELIQRKPDELMPISLHQYPIEISPSIQEINHLFTRISASQQEQRQFVADAAHELRTPITALNLQTQILLQELPEHPSLLQLNKGLARMQHLVSQLLHLAQQDAALFEFHTQTECSLKEIAIHCVEQLIHLALAKDIDLGMEQQDQITVWGQSSALHSIIYNLIDNAIKYTPEHGTINVSTISTETAVIVQVEDSGPGISPEQYEHILKRFYRIQPHAEIGSGLGLSIVNKATTRLGGQLHFDRSKSLGGLKVVVQFPFEQPPAQTSI